MQYPPGDEDVEDAGGESCEECRKDLTFILREMKRRFHNESCGDRGKRDPVAWRELFAPVADIGKGKGDAEANRVCEHVDEVGKNCHVQSFLQVCGDAG